MPGAFTAGSQPDGNSVVLVAPGGLVVIDTGRHAEHTDAVLDLARYREYLEGARAELCGG